MRDETSRSDRNERSVEHKLYIRSRKYLESLGCLMSAMMESDSPEKPYTERRVEEATLGQIEYQIQIREEEDKAFDVVVYI